MNNLVERLRDDDCDFDMQHRELIACEIELLEKERDNWENACAHWEKEAIESQAREKNLTARLDRFTRIAECGSSLGDDLDLWEKLVECQAREAKLREAIKWGFEAATEGDDSDRIDATNKLLEAARMPHDDTALKEYRKKVLLEAAIKLEEEPSYDYWNGIYKWDRINKLRRMAEE